MPDHPYGILSLLPPLAAIVLAIVTRRVVVSLFAGVFTGVVVMALHHPAAYSPGAEAGDTIWWALPIAAVASTFRDHLWPTLVSEEKLAVFAFTTLMGAMVGVIRQCGGMQGLVNTVARWANNARRGQLAAWAVGLIVFFDDYANTMLLGGTFRPLFDRLKLSREKLAYLVDSTAAPVSGMALVSTWVAGEIGYVQEGLAQLPDDAGANWEAFQLFLWSIPYRFYVIWALLLVPIVAWLGRDFSAMAKAERAMRDGHSGEEGESVEHASESSLGDSDVQPSHWLNALAPIAVTVAAIVWLMFRSGRTALLSEGASVESLSLMQIFGNADTYMSLVWGTLMGVTAAAMLSWLQRLLTFDQIRVAARDGALHMTPALAILWLASVLSSLTGNREPPTALPAAAMASQQADAETLAAYPHQFQRLYTGDYLGGVLQNRMPVWLAPTAVFILAGAIAFSTGTSWGTMGIVMPLAISSAYSLLETSLGSPPAPDNPVLIGCIGSVLAGAIFGDHCSPISDTTVMSSQACGCDHIAHVRTQLPYAMLAAAVSIVLGTIPIAFGVSPWLLLPLGVVAMAVVLRTVGEKVAT